MYLGPSILDVIKIVIEDYWYGCVRPDTSCYPDTNSFVVNVKSEDIYAELAEDVETKLDISNYEVDRPLPTSKNGNVIGLMKDELGRIKWQSLHKMKPLRPKMYSCITVVNE